MDGPRLSQRLPPLNALRTFEAAGRLQSIRGAAAELIVTPGAVSRQVRVLEEWLGVSLFRHDARSIELTARGARYLEAVSEHLYAIAAATDELNGRKTGAALRLRSSTFFATNWLVPRLTKFHKLQPWVELELTTAVFPEDFGRRDVDAEIRPGDGRWAGYDAELLLSDLIVCVCSPGYRTEHQLNRPADLARLGSEEILRSIASPGLWQRWLDNVGVAGVDPEGGASFGDSVLTSRAAAAGHGVSLAPRSFIEPELAAGSLVALFPSASDIRLNLYLACPSDRVRRRAFRAFRDWLLAELRHPTAATSKPSRPTAQ